MLHNGDLGIRTIREKSCEGELEEPLAMPLIQLESYGGNITSNEFDVIMKLITHVNNAPKPGTHPEGWR